jgi:hypothetical protein
MDAAAVAVPVYAASEGKLVVSRYVVVRADATRLPMALRVDELSRLLFVCGALRVFAIEHAPVCIVIQPDHSVVVHYYTQGVQRCYATLYTCLQQLRGVEQVSICAVTRRRKGSFFMTACVFAQDAFQAVHLAEEIEGECFVPVWSLLVAYMWDAATGTVNQHTTQQVPTGQLHLPRVCDCESQLLHAVSVQREKAVSQMLAGFVMAVKWVDGSWLSYCAREDGGLVPRKRFQLHGSALPSTQCLHLDPRTERAQHLE